MAWKKTVWGAVDRFIFIGVGVIGTIVTTYATGYIKLKSPEVVVTRSYSEVDASKPVDKAGLGLKLDYESDPQADFGVYRVGFHNDGNAPEEDLRLQIKFPAPVEAVYYAPPDFRVFRPRMVEFVGGEFYMELPEFPPRGSGWIAFKVTGGRPGACDTTVKLVGKNEEGIVGEVVGCR